MPAESAVPPNHRIRLRGPWDFVWLKGRSAVESQQRHGRLELPTTWCEAFGDQSGSVRISRQFGRPTGLDKGERVWLEVETHFETSALLNGDWLGTVPPGVNRFDVTARLAERNRLDLDLREEPERSDEALMEVVLVIEEF